MNAVNEEEMLSISANPENASASMAYPAYEAALTSKTLEGLKHNIKYKLLGRKIKKLTEKYKKALATVQANAVKVAEVANQKQNVTSITNEQTNLMKKAEIDRKNAINMANQAMRFGYNLTFLYNELGKVICDTVDKKAKPLKIPTKVYSAWLKIKFLAKGVVDKKANYATVKQLYKSQFKQVIGSIPKPLEMTEQVDIDKLNERISNLVTIPSKLAEHYGTAIKEEMAREEEENNARKAAEQVRQAQNQANIDLSVQKVKSEPITRTPPALILPSDNRGNNDEQRAIVTAGEVLDELRKRRDGATGEMREHLTAAVEAAENDLTKLTGVSYQNSLPSTHLPMEEPSSDPKVTESAVVAIWEAGEERRQELLRNATLSSVEPVGTSEISYRDIENMPTPESPTVEAVQGTEQVSKPDGGNDQFESLPRISDETLAYIERLKVEVANALHLNVGIKLTDRQPGSIEPNITLQISENQPNSEDAVSLSQAEAIKHGITITSSYEEPNPTIDVHILGSQYIKDRRAFANKDSMGKPINIKLENPILGGVVRSISIDGNFTPDGTITVHSSQGMGDSTRTK